MHFYDETIFNNEENRKIRIADIKHFVGIMRYHSY
jgi:hypothetical protein